MKILLSCFFVLSFLVGSSQGYFSYKTYGGESDDYGFSIVATSDSGYIISGKSRFTLFLAKIDKYGEIVWKKDASNFNYENSEGTRILSIGGGDYILNGQKGNDHLIMKFNENGDTLFTKVLRMNGLMTSVLQAVGGSIIRTLDGGFAAVTAAKDYTVSPRITYTLLVKYDENFDTLWTSRYNGGRALSNGFDLTQTADGSFYTTGCIDNEGPNCKWTINTAKLDANGNLLWNREYDLGMGFSIKPLSDNNLIFTGYTYTSSGDESIWIYKINPDGDTVSVYRGGPGGISAVVPTSDGGFLAVPGIKLDGQGNVEWVNDDLEGYSIYSACQKPDGGFAFIGSIDGEEPNYDQILVITTDSLGFTTGQVMVDYHKINVYPNPVFDKKIKIFGLSNNGFRTVEIINCQGRIIGIEQLSADNYLDLSRYSSGLYNLRISDNSRTFLKRVELLH